MRISIKLVMVLFFVPFISFSQSDKKVNLMTASSIQNAVKKNMVRFLKSDKVKELRTQYPEIKGYLMADVSVRTKKTGGNVRKFANAKVITVFVAKSNIENVKFKGLLKDLLKEFELDFKIKYGVQQKVRYNFNLN